MAEVIPYEPRTGHLRDTLPVICQEVRSFLTPGLTRGTFRFVNHNLLGMGSPLVIGFKFGITNDVNKRASKYGSGKSVLWDYEYLEPLYRTTKYEYNQDMDRGLIDYFKDSPFAGNLRSGGAGRKPDSGPYYTYVVYKIA